MFGWRKNIGVAVALFLVLVLVASACAPGMEVKKEQAIKIAVDACYTGPIASTGVPMSNGMIDHLKWTNEHGGISGVDVEIMWEDTQWLLTKALPAYKRFKSAGVMAVMTGSTVPTTALTPSCAREGFLILIPATLSIMAETKPTWVIGGVPLCGESLAWVKWVKDNWKQERRPRIGLLMYDTAWPWDVLEYALRRGDEMGWIDFVGHEVLPVFGVVDSATEWLRLMEKEPDWIETCTTGAVSVVTIKDAARLDIQKKGTKLITHAHGLDEAIVDIVGEDAEDWHVLSATPFPYETELPGMKEVHEACQKYRGTAPVCGYVSFWVMSTFLCEGIRMAIDEVGSENLTRQDVRHALLTMQNFDTGLIPLISMSEDNPIYHSKGTKIYQVRQGGFHSVTDHIQVPLPLRDLFQIP